MAVYKCKYRIGFTDIYKNNEINNRAIIKILENAGGMHSDSIKCGYSDVERTGRGWVILAWKIKVLSRPKYNTEVETHTWVRDINKIFTYRDYEMYDEGGKLAVIATSKWAMIDTKRGKIAEITPEIEKDYNPEERHQQKTEYRFMDEMLIDYSEKIVAIAGHRMEFTKIEYQIIEFLSMHPGQVFDKERIYAQVCGYDAEGDSRTITELVRRIRKKIADYSEKEYIETVWGIGYRWKK